MSSLSDNIILYHGTSREDDFNFPRKDIHPLYTYSLQFSWFTTSRDAAERFARLDFMNGNRGDPRVLCYLFDGRNKDIVESIDSISEHGRRVFGEGNFILKNGGKHSLVYRVVEKGRSTGDNQRAHYEYFMTHGKYAFTEKGSIFESIDWVFLENPRTGIGAHNWLTLTEKYYL